MATETLTSPATQNLDDVVQHELLHIAERARNVGELREGVHERSQQLLAFADQQKALNGEGAYLAQSSPVSAEKLAQRMAKETEELKAVTRGFEKVALDNLPTGTNGQTELENPDAAVVDRSLVATKKELQRTLIHEDHPEAGHASQAIPQAPNPDAALVVEKAKLVGMTGAVEGDVERGTAIEMGEAPTAKREGQPPKDYGEGQDAANAAIELVGEAKWNKALKETGNLGELQKAIWEARVAKGEDMLTILEEAEQTGHKREAVEVVTQMAA